MSLTSLKNILGNTRKGTGTQCQLTAAYIVHVANIQLQEFMSGHDLQDASVVAYSRGVLTVHVINGVVSNFLRQQESDFFQHLHEVLPGLVMKRIRYKIARKKSL